MLMPETITYAAWPPKRVGAKTTQATPSSARSSAAKRLLSRRGRTIITDKSTGVFRRIGRNRPDMDRTYANGAFSLRQHGTFPLCRSFFRLAGRKNDLHRGRNPWFA